MNGLNLKDAKDIKLGDKSIDSIIFVTNNKSSIEIWKNKNS